MQNHLFNMNICFHSQSIERVHWKLFHGYKKNDIIIIFFIVTRLQNSIEQIIK